MKKWDDRESSDSKRNVHEDDPRKEIPGLNSLPKQPPETLRPGYSWVRHQRQEHPGWDFVTAEGIPWAPLARPLAEARVALVTTAGLYVDGQKPFTSGPAGISDELRRQRFGGRGDPSHREIARAVAAEDLRITHAYFDHSDAEQDPNCLFPLDRLIELEYEAFIGEVAGTHYSVMGYLPEPQRLAPTQEAIISGLRRQGVDAVLVTPGDPLCHQTAALLQRAIEAAGIPTVSVTVCPDITRHLKVSRAVSLPFPLGNPFGHPFDDGVQLRIVKAALQSLESAQTPGAIEPLPFEWVDEDEEE